MYRIAFIVSLVIISAHTALGLSGSGTEAEPWRIESPADFDEFAADANYWDDYTRLETDVNLAGRTYSSAVIAPDIDNSNDPFDGTAFTGVFDGNDKRIINLTIDDGGAGNDYLGLFGCINDGEVKNLGLEGGSVSGTGDRIGGMVGDIFDGSVSNCYNTGSVSGDDYVGGLVGRNWYSSVSNCYSTGDVSGNNVIGGLVGYVKYGNVSNCYSTGDVSGNYVVGGLVGGNNGSVSNCYSTGDVSGDYCVGGLMGDNYYDYSYISNCYSTGDVNGLEGVGGLAGVNYGTVFNCYSIADVNGVRDVGGLVGGNFDSVSNCFWDTDIQTHGVTESIGFNHGGTITNVSGLTTIQMQTMSTFTDAGWDFEEIWDVGEKQTYPYLRWYLSGDLNHDGMVNMVDFAILASHWLEGAGG